MLRKILRKIHRNEKGITGLETAIILIAFVVVASVFAYTVLSSGQGLYYVLGTADPFFKDIDDTNNTLIDLYHDFSLELKTANGATLILEQETPGQIDTLTTLP